MTELEGQIATKSGFHYTVAYREMVTHAAKITKELDSLLPDDDDLRNSRLVLLKRVETALNGAKLKIIKGHADGQPCRGCEVQHI